ncbi:hypothetical protein SB679_24855, partial [Chryseobacterium sp. SIMBA_029]
GFLCQGHRNPHSLALPAGKLVDVSIRELKSASGFESALHSMIVKGGVPRAPTAEEALVRKPTPAHEVADGDAIRSRRVLREEAQHT